MFITRFNKGRPRGFPPDKDVYVCESRYNEEKFRFAKIKTWASCVPDEVRERDYEMDLFDAPRRMRKVPSPIKHLLREDAKETDELPKPTWGNPNAPPIVGAVHRRPREANVSQPSSLCCCVFLEDAAAWPVTLALAMPSCSGPSLRCCCCCRSSGRFCAKLSACAHRRHLCLRLTRTRATIIIRILSTAPLVSREGRNFLLISSPGITTARAHSSTPGSAARPSPNGPSAPRLGSSSVDALGVV